VSKIHLAGEAAKEIPAGREDGENAGQNQDAQQVGVLGNEGQKKENQKEKKNRISWKDEHLFLKLIFFR
jgi:hypothetical protein